MSLPSDSSALMVLESEALEYMHTLKRRESLKNKIKAGERKCTTSIECQPTLSRVKVEDLVLDNKLVEEKTSSIMTNRLI